MAKARETRTVWMRNVRFVMNQRDGQGWRGRPREPHECQAQPDHLVTSN